MSDSSEPPRPAPLPRVDTDQTEASTLDRRRALRAAEREFEGVHSQYDGGELWVRVVEKVEEYPDFHMTFELMAVEPGQPFFPSFFLPLISPGWWRLMRIWFRGGRRAKIWQERLVVDELGDTEQRVTKGSPDGRFTDTPDYGVFVDKWAG